MPKSNSKDKLEEKIKKLEIKIKNWPEEMSLKNDILSDLKDICSKMGKGFLFFGGNKEAKEIEKQLKTYDKWKPKNELYPNTMKVARNIQKIKELEEIGKQLEEKIKPIVDLDETKEFLEKEIDTETAKRKTNHQRVIYILNVLGSFSTKLSAKSSDKGVTNVKETLKQGRLDLGDDLRKILGMLPSKVHCTNDMGFLTIVNKISKIAWYIGQIEQQVKEMLDLFNKEYKEINGKTINLTTEEKNEIYARLEAEGQSLDTEKIITTIITVIDRNFKPEDKKNKELVDTLVEKLKDALAEPLKELKKLIP